MSNDKEFEKKLAAYESAEKAYDSAKLALEAVLKDRVGQLVKVNGKPHRVAKRDNTVKDSDGKRQKVGESYFLRCLVSDEVMQALQS